MARRILVIGLDGATFDLILPWARERFLPNIDRLMRKGVWGELQSTIPPITGAAWVSFMTGRNPGKTGIYDFMLRKNNDYDLKLINSTSVNNETIWDILRENDIRTCVFNFPIYPPYKVKGFFVSGFMAPSTKVEFTWPESLKLELHRLVKGYEFCPNPLSYSSEKAYLEDLYRVTEKQLKVIKYLMNKDWQFFMAYLDGTDNIQHAMWKYMDDSHLLFDPEKAKKYGNAILDYWQRIDKFIGELKIPEDTTLIVMSDHGFGKYDKIFYTNVWLMEKGYLRLKPSSKRSSLKSLMIKRGLTSDNFASALKKLRIYGFVSKVIPRKLRAFIPSSMLSFSNFKEEIDWASTVAFALPHTSNFGHIYINLKGREPQGCIEHGEEYQQIREEIITALKGLKHPKTGEIVKVQVYKPEEIYTGPYVSYAPDIIFFIDDMKASFQTGLHNCAFTEGTLAPFHNATHRMDGIFIAFGKDIKNGEIIENAEIIDLAPTFLHILDIPIPRDMDGKILREIFKEGSEFITKEIIYQEKDEKEEVKKRIRKLKDFGKI